MEYSSADYQFIKRNINKHLVIKAKGGKCIDCGECKISCLEFHHLDEKKFEIGNKIKTNPQKYIEELNKCVVLCSNCHKKRHEVKSNDLFLEYKKLALQNKICDCGYSDIKHLQLHHIGNKKYELNELLRTMNIKYEIKCFDEFPNYVKEEIGKCVVLCPNCHKDIHFDKKRYEKFFDVISAGIDGKERVFRTSTIPVSIQQEVLNMAKSGYSFKYLTEKYKLNKTTVSKIIKTLDPVFYKNRKRVCPNSKKAKKEVSFELKNEILEMAKLHNKNKLSKLLGISLYIINRTLRENMSF